MFNKAPLEQTLFAKIYLAEGLGVYDIDSLSDKIKKAVREILEKTGKDFDLYRSGYLRYISELLDLDDCLERENLLKYEKDEDVLPKYEVRLLLDRILSISKVFLVN